MSENEGIQIKKATKPNNTTQVGYYEILSGTISGRDKWLVRENKNKKTLNITRHNADAKHNPPYKKQGNHDLVYTDILHYNKIETNKTTEQQATELAKKIKTKIQTKGKA